MLEKFWIQELTRPAFVQWLENEPAPVIIIGIGSIEQHGPHLPLGTDSLAVSELIHRVAKRTNSVCVHPCFPGYSPHHMGFPGTVTFSEDTLKAVLMDTIGSLTHHGIKRFMLLNGHGGNTNIVNLVVQVAKREFNVMVTAPLGPSNTEMAKTITDRQKRFWDVHSGPSETSLVLKLFPELVEMGNLDDWEPTLDVDSKLMSFLDPDREDHEMVNQIFRACQQPNTHQFTSCGVYGTNDPRTAVADAGRQWLEDKVAYMAEFVKVWKTIPIPPAFA